MEGLTVMEQISVIVVLIFIVALIWTIIKRSPLFDLFFYVLLFSIVVWLSMGLKIPFAVCTLITLGIFFLFWRYVRFQKE